MLEKGRLYYLRKDGTKDSLYFHIKRRFLFGSSEYCTVRMYINGIYPEHCVLTIEDQGKAYLEPLHPSALTLVNGIKIKHKVSLKDNDVITVFIKEFQFAYQPNSLSRKLSFERLVLPYSKQIQPSQKFEISTLGKTKEASQLFRESSVSNINPKKQICIIKSDIKIILKYLLKFTHQEPVNVLYEKMNNPKNNSLIKYMNQNVTESPEERRNLSLKLYEFITFVRGLLTKDDKYLSDFCLIFEYVWKYCLVRASHDFLFLPIKSLNLKDEINVHKKSLQSRIFACTSKNPSPVPEIISERDNHCINSLATDISSSCKEDRRIENQYSSRKISISYKKRVSLAVKRYHLRKRKSIMMAKAAEIQFVENLDSLAEGPQMKDKCREIISDEQGVVLNIEKRQTPRTKRKRGYSKEKLQDQEKEINIEEVKVNTTSEQKQEKRKNRRAAAKKTNLKPGKENISELPDNSSGNEVNIPILREQKQSKDKQNSKNKGLKQCEKAEEQTTTIKLEESKETKQSYKKKKKEAATNKTALKDETGKKITSNSPVKQNNSSETNKPKSKKGNYKKKKELTQEKNVLCKSLQKCDMQELPCCQRITRSMAKIRY